MSFRETISLGRWLIALGRKPEIDFGSLTRDDIRKRPPRSARHGPAERSVPGVEEEVGIARAPHERDVGRRGRAQAGPERGALVVGGAGKDLARAADER